MFEFFSSTQFFFILGSIAIVIPITYGFVSDYKRDHKILTSTVIVLIIVVLLFFISDYVLSLIAKL